MDGVLFYFIAWSLHHQDMGHWIQYRFLHQPPNAGMNQLVHTWEQEH